MTYIIPTVRKTVSKIFFQCYYFPKKHSLVINTSQTVNWHQNSPFLSWHTIVTIFYLPSHLAAHKANIFALLHCLWHAVRAWSSSDAMKRRCFSSKAHCITILTGRGCLLGSRDNQSIQLGCYCLFAATLFIATDERHVIKFGNSTAVRQLCSCCGDCVNAVIRFVHGNEVNL